MQETNKKYANYDLAISLTLFREIKQVRQRKTAEKASLISHTPFQLKPKNENFTEPEILPTFLRFSKQISFCWQLKFA